MLTFLLVPLLALASPALARPPAPAAEVPNTATPSDITGLPRQEAASGLAWYVVHPGVGNAAEAGNTVFLQYTGWLADGTRFDSSWDRDAAFKFALGAGRVIKGWDEGVVGMQVGEVRQLRIPAALAYGENGAGGVIPPNADLIFDVQLVKIRGR